MVAAVKDWPGRVAFVIAAFVAGGWATALILSATPWTDTISETGANLLSTVGGVLAGGVASYLGWSASEQQQKNKPGTNDRDIETPEDPS